MSDNQYVDPFRLGANDPDGTKVLFGDQTWRAGGGASLFVPFVSRQDANPVGANFEWANMPAASTEFAGVFSHRRLVDLTSATEYLFSTELAVAGAAAAVLDMEYSANLSSPSWTSMAGGTLSLASAALVNTGWQSIPVGARGLVLLRIMGSGGNATADPRFYSILAQFR